MDSIKTSKERLGESLKGNSKERLVGKSYNFWETETSRVCIRLLSIITLILVLTCAVFLYKLLSITYYVKYLPTELPDIPAKIVAVEPARFDGISYRRSSIQLKTLNGITLEIDDKDSVELLEKHIGEYTMIRAYDVYTSGSKSKVDYIGKSVKPVKNNSLDSQFFSEEMAMQISAEDKGQSPKN